MDGKQPSQRKSPRDITTYTSHLIFDKKGSSQLTLLQIASCNLNGLGKFPDESKDDSNTGPDDTEIRGSGKSKRHTVPDVMTCNCCQVTFADRDEQLSHYKCDWHRYNIHQRLRGQPGISEDNFEKLAAADDVSSISGSDDDEEDDEDVVKDMLQPTCDAKSHTDSQDLNVLSECKSHKVFFKNSYSELISLYRCLMHHKKNPITRAEELVNIAMDTPNKSKWIILMLSAGHFAGAVFQGKEILDHKTFHRYTIRAKRGTVQSTRDNQGRAPKSAGARLRRYNEAALSQDVSDLMNTWTEHFKSCDLIFGRIPVNNRGMFYGGKIPCLKKEDMRIRVIPFPTRRPTFNEVKRVHWVLASVECYGLASEVCDIIPMSPPRMFVRETGELQLREPRPLKNIAKKSHVHKQKTVPSVSTKAQTASVIDACTTIEISNEDLQDDIEVVDADLVEVAETIDFSHLREFETALKKRHMKKKKESSPATKDANSTNGEDRIHWRNKLFTACKTGDLVALKQVVADIKNTPVVSEPSISIKDIEVQRLSKDQDHPGDHTASNTDSAISSCAAESKDKTDLSQTGSNKIVADPESDTQQLEARVCDMPKSKFESMSGTLESEHSLKEDDVQSKVGHSLNTCLLHEIINTSLKDTGSSYLHVAAKHGHSDIVMALLQAGVDPAIKDRFGKTPYGVGEMETRNTFRRFMAMYPDRYDYLRAQVPSPLTPKMEAEKKQKNAEKRKIKKKALAEKNKEKKAIEAVAREDNREKERFLSLSDREKRALAAEKRILQQCNEQSADRPVLSRCWQCGSDITGQVPFEYADYKFCTTKCLRDHRTKVSS